MEPKPLTNISLIVELETVEALEYLQAWVTMLNSIRNVTVRSASVYAYDDEEEPDSEDESEDEAEWNALDPENMPESDQVVMKFEDTPLGRMKAGQDGD